MAKASTKNLKLTLIALIVSVLFIVVNIGVWDTAKASPVVNDKHGGKNFQGVNIPESDKYEFSEAQGNFRPVVLNNKNVYKSKNNDERRVVNRADYDEAASQRNDLYLKDGFIDWLQNDERPESWDDYEFGPSDDPNKWELRDLHFVFANYIDDEDVNWKGGALAVAYDKEAPGTSGDQGFDFYFRVTCKDAMQVKGFDSDQWKDYIINTHDHFKDFEDNNDNGDCLENAGLKDGTFKRALDQVNYAMRERDRSEIQYNNMIDAIMDGRIEIELYKVVCQKEFDRHWTVYENLDPSLSLLDMKHPEDKGHAHSYIGKTDHNKYMQGDNGVKNIRLGVNYDMLTVYFDGIHPEFLGDVNYRFTVVAANRNGEIEAKFRAEGSSSITWTEYEQIWQSDCIWGDKTIVHNAESYDGYYYVEKIEVAD